MKTLYSGMAECLYRPSINILNAARTRLFGWTMVMTIISTITGCNSFGPDALRGTHPLYNDAIVSSMNDQFIQNIVRLHYRDPTFFLDVASVTASMKLDMGGGLDQSSVGLNGGADIMQYSLGGAYSTTPTISYSPLQGESFVKSVLSPIPIDVVFALSASGWNAQRVFGLCVERMNGIENAPNASGPTPQKAPKNGHKFKRLMQLIEEVSIEHLIAPRTDPKTKETQLEIKSSAEFAKQIREIKDLLGLDQNRQFYHVNSDFIAPSPDTISIRTRSLMSIFFYLSHHVDTPQAHRDAGLVTITRNPDGSVFDWSTTAAGSVFHIRQSNEQPEMAFVAIPYRGNWFYLADNDLDSKSTFMLLMQLFRRQAGATKAVGPTLTIPVH
jgi:hypothetical protein